MGGAEAAADIIIGLSQFRVSRLPVLVRTVVLELPVPEARQTLGYLSPRGRFDGLDSGSQPREKRPLVEVFEVHHKMVPGVVDAARPPACVSKPLRCADGDVERFFAGPVQRTDHHAGDDAEFELDHRRFPPGLVPDARTSAGPA